MSMLLAAAIIVVSAALAITAILLVRRRAPDGGYFNDGDRAAGVFGVLATGFAIVLGFVIVLAFTSYDASRLGAETEALLVAQQVETAQFLPESVSGRLTGELVCYARSVIHEEWPRMEAGSLGEQVNPWGVQLFRTLGDAEPETSNEETAFGKWLDQTSDREAARNDRIHGAVGVMPSPLWVMLFFATALVLTFMLFFADSGERVIVQALIIGSVVSIITAMLLTLWVLDNPFHSGVGGLRPVAMERTVEILAQELEVIGGDVGVPCDELGQAV